MAIIVAGSETLTTALAGAVHYLLRNPSSLSRLIAENRAAFQAEDEITNARAATLPYLNAVLTETLRMVPPLPDGLRREVPRGGAVIAGIHVPEGTTVSVPCWASFHSSSNFEDPDSFIPERWLREAAPQGDGSASTRARFENDQKAAFQPFSIGPHNCLGQPLAWLEMRLILSRLLWNFEMGIPRDRDGQEGTWMGEWTQQKIYWTWDKVPLEVEIRNANRVPRPTSAS
jgi:cytochrome P450